MKGKLLDISMTISPDIQVYKNKAEKKPIFNIVATHEKNDVHETRLDLDLHTGTHIDAPLHMVDGGSTIDTYVLDNMVVPCRVVDLTHVEKVITADDMKGLELGHEFVLLKTKNSFTDQFDFEFVFVDKTAARFLVDYQIKGVGIDALGIERSQPDHETHKQLLSAGIPIIEGLRLKNVAPGDYTLIAAPLKIAGVEGAPTRALLLAE